MSAKQLQQSDTGRSSAVSKLLTDLSDTSPYVDSAQFRKMRSPVQWTAISVGLIAIAIIVDAAFYLTVRPDGSDLTGEPLFLLTGLFGLGGLVGVGIAFRYFGAPVIVGGFRQLGALLAAKSLGYHVVWLAIGPLNLIKQAGQWKIGPHRSKHLAMVGFSLIIDPSGGTTSRREGLAFSGVLLGPVFIGVVLLAPFVVLYILQLTGAIRLGQALSLPGIFVLLAFLWALVVAAIDLTRLARIMRGGLEGVAARLFRQTATASVEGIRPRDYPPQLVNDLISFADNLNAQPFERALSHLLLYEYFIDSGDVERAERRISEAHELLDSMPSKKRQMRLAGVLAGFYDETAYLYGFHKGDALTAIAWLGRANDETTVERCVRLRAEAAVLFSNGDLVAAKERAERALVLGEDVLSQGTRLWQTDLLTQMIAAAESSPHDRRIEPTA